MYIVSKFPYQKGDESPYPDCRYAHLNQLPLDPVEGDVYGEGVSDLVLYQSPSRSRKILSVEGGRWIGEASEGIVIEVRVTLQTALGPQQLVLAEKIFKHPQQTEFWRNYESSYPQGNPELQWKIAHKLRQANREQQLGIHLPATFALRRFPDKRARILSTLLPVVRDFPRHGDEFLRDRDDQRKRVNQAGFLATDDAFFPVWDDQRKRVYAVVGDYGGVLQK